MASQAILLSENSTKLKSIETVFEALEQHHKKVIEKALGVGCVFPVFYPDINRWYDDDMTGPNFNDGKHWVSRYNSQGVLSPLTVEALNNMHGSVAKLSETEGGIMRYYAEMGGFSEIIPNRFFHGSRQGANVFWNQEHQEACKTCGLKSALRVCLENEDRVNSDAACKFEETIRIPLNDFDPLAAPFSMNLTECDTFFSGLKRAYEVYLNHPDRAILVHCSQGQSRSGIFVLLFLMLLVQTGFSPIDDADSTHSNSVILLRCMNFLLEKRAVVSISDRWQPFIDYFFATDCRLYDILYPKEEKEEAKKEDSSPSSSSNVENVNEPTIHPTFDEHPEEKFEGSHLE